MSRQPNFTREQCDQRIKQFLFERGFDAVSTAELADLLTLSRATIFSWYKDTAGIIASGVRRANSDLLISLSHYIEHFGAEQAATRRARAETKTGKAGSADPKAVRPVFFQYCRLLDDQEVCGSIVLQATMLSPRVSQKGTRTDLGNEAVDMVRQHARKLGDVFKKAGFDAAPKRGRMLVAAATGLVVIPKGLKPDNRYEMPGVFFEAVANAPLE